MGRYSSGDLSFSTTLYGLFIGCLKFVTWRACTVQPRLAFCEEIVWQALQHMCSFEFDMRAGVLIPPRMGCSSGVLNLSRGELAHFSLAWHFERKQSGRLFSTCVLLNLTCAAAISNRARISGEI